MTDSEASLARSAAAEARTKGKQEPVKTGLDASTKVALWILGSLALLYVMLRFPDLGQLIESYNRF